MQISVGEPASKPTYVEWHMQISLGEPASNTKPTYVESIVAYANFFRVKTRIF